MSEKFVSINEAARLTGLSRGFVRQGCKAGRFPCIRIGDGCNAVYKLDYGKFLAVLDRMVEGQADE